MSSTELAGSATVGGSGRSASLPMAQKASSLSATFAELDLVER